MNASFQNQALMPRLVAELHAQFAESAKLEQAIKRKFERGGLWRVNGNAHRSAKQA